MMQLGDEDGNLTKKDYAIAAVAGLITLVAAYAALFGVGYFVGIFVYGFRLGSGI